MASVFSKIMQGEIPGNIAYEDECCIVLMTINPLQTGHVLVIPREEVDHFTDLDPELWAHCTAVAHRVGQAQKELYDAPRIGLAVVGFEVPHVHIHVWPAQSIADFSFEGAATDVDMEALAVEAKRLAQALAS